MIRDHSSITISQSMGGGSGKILDNDMGGWSTEKIMDNEIMDNDFTTGFDNKLHFPLLFQSK